MNRKNVRFSYVGTDNKLKKVFSDPDLFIMDYPPDYIGSPISTEELKSRFVEGPAHVNKDGRVMRYGQCIGNLGKEFLVEGEMEAKNESGG